MGPLYKFILIFLILGFSNESLEEGSANSFDTPYVSMSFAGEYVDFEEAEAGLPPRFRKLSEDTVIFVVRERLPHSSLKLESRYRIPDKILEDLKEQMPRQARPLPSKAPKPAPSVEMAEAEELLFCEFEKGLLKQKDQLLTHLGYTAQNSCLEGRDLSQVRLTMAFEDHNSLNALHGRQSLLNRFAPLGTTVLFEHLPQNATPPMKARLFFRHKVSPGSLATPEKGLITQFHPSIQGLDDDTLAAYRMVDKTIKKIDEIYPDFQSMVGKIDQKTRRGFAEFFAVNPELESVADRAFQLNTSPEKIKEFIGNKTLHTLWTSQEEKFKKFRNRMLTLAFSFGNFKGHIHNIADGWKHGWEESIAMTNPRFRLTNPEFDDHSFYVLLLTLREILKSELPFDERSLADGMLYRDFVFAHQIEKNLCEVLDRGAKRVVAVVGAAHTERVVHFLRENPLLRDLNVDYKSMMDPAPPTTRVPDLVTSLRKWNCPAGETTGPGHSEPAIR